MYKAEDRDYTGIVIIDNLIYEGTEKEECVLLLKLNVKYRLLCSIFSCIHYALIKN